MVPSLAKARRVVIKLGSSLVAENAQLRSTWMKGIAGDIAQLHAQGCEVILVSSGAVALGRPLVGLGAEGLSLEEKQAAAAAGQPLLMQAWQQAFASHSIHVAQLLLTLQDSEERRRYLNARATFTTLLQHRLIPIVNENDTVATAELKFGDNDRLAARVAVMLAADVLILLSDVDGLYTKNPRLHADAEHLEVIPEVTPAILAMGQGAASNVSSGGMKTKLEAAQMVTRAGCHLVIAQGVPPNALQSLLAGGKASWFLANTKPQLARKHWIASAVQFAGQVTIDPGAAAALRDGRSLLPAGVVEISGTFERGDMVQVLAPEGRVLAHGIINYSAVEVEKIRGKKSDAIAMILGYASRDTLIHRDDLAVL